MYSDLRIPSTDAIIARATDVRESAVRLQDAAAVRQLNRLIDSVPHARLCWQLGTLIVDSPSGGRYHVSRGGCDCLNAQKGQRRCWHVALFELLLDMLDTEAETADSAADEATRIYELFQARLAATAQAIERMRYAQGRIIGQRLAAARRVYLEAA